jgi:LAO/AO transport system kinase
VAELVAAARGGERRATARLLTLVERGGPAADEVAERSWTALDGGAAGARAHVVGVTGPPGAGKSTLIAVWTTRLVERGYRPAVLAVDPSSPLTGGAILGDRVRMAEATAAGVFIRSMATRGHAGGLALAVPGMVRLLDLAGFDPVIVETVGVGQVEVEVASAADTVLVVVTPGMGDAVQANKAGLLEVADLFAVNKSDRPDAADVRRDLELMLDLSDLTGHGRSGAGTGSRPSITSTVATTGVGVDKLADAVEAHLAGLVATGALASHRAERWRAEVRSHLDRLLMDASRHALDGPVPGGGSPAAVARSLAGRVADHVADHVGGAVEGDR